MAVAPVAAPAPALVEEGVAAPMAPGGDAPGEEASESLWSPVATILKNDETGEFMLVTGDEPEDGSEPDGPTFPDGPSVLRAMMDKLEGKEEVDKAFAEGYEGSAKKPPPAPMAA